MASFEKSISLDQKLASSYLRLAKIHEKSGDMQEQVRVLESCIQNIPDFQDAYTELARLYRQKGQWEKAVAVLETAVKKDPEAPLPANNLAWLYLEHDDTNINRAFALAQSAYERLPKDAAVADTLGWAYYKKNLFTRAVWLLEEARSIDPEQPLIHFHLGMVFNAQGNTTASKKV